MQAQLFLPGPGSASTWGLACTPKALALRLLEPEPLGLPHPRKASAFVVMTKRKDSCQQLGNLFQCHRHELPLVHDPKYKK